MPAIKIESMGKTYRGKKGRRIDALRDLSLEINQGEVFGFLGPNGAGKSTTIKLIMGMVRPSSGCATICGRPVTSPEARQNVGYLPENPSFYDFLTAREYLQFVGNSFKMLKRVLDEQIERVLALMGIEAAADRPIKGYSKGMVQRLGVAQTLIHDPDIYIMDEPMSGLDPLGRALVKDVIRDLRQRGKTVFFSTHITTDVELVCDRVGIISDGILQTVSEVQTIMQSGVEGYQVKVSACSVSALGDFVVSADIGGVLDVSLPRERFQEFMELISRIGGSVELVEPRRRSLENYFLDIVGKSNA